MFLNGRGRIISCGHFMTKKNNKKMSIVTMQVNGVNYKFFGSGKIPSFNFGDFVEFTLIAQQQTESEYTFYLAKASKFHNQEE